MIIDFNRIYVGKKDKKVYSIERLLLIGDKYHRPGVDYKQQRAFFCDYCREVLYLFDDASSYLCWGVRRVRNYQYDDNVNIERAKREIVNMLMSPSWSGRQDDPPMCEFPSCKKLLEFSAEVIIEKAKNLEESDIVKAWISVALRGLKVGEVIRIADVLRYYEAQLKELRNEIDETGVNLSAITQLLLNKFNT